MQNSLYKILNISLSDRKAILKFSRKTGIPIKRLDYYNLNGILPSEEDLIILEKETGLSREAMMLKMGIYTEELRNLIAENSSSILLNKKPIRKKEKYPKPKLAFSTALGKLYESDCMSVLQETKSETFDMIFADPPFNLKKSYLSNINDDLNKEDYIAWTEKWLLECIRTLKTGGSLFLWNLPKWNTYFSNFLNNHLNFRHWIAVDIKYSLPISGRLYPSHYSLLYYVKGEKANTFHPDRLPMEVCPKCFTDLKDYGGYKDKMNPLGINISDIWYDIPPVRHRKYKRRVEANELSIKLLDRIIEMSTNEGDLVFDPFGGSGTTYIVAEIKKRNWIGVELGPIDSIIDRFNLTLEENNHLEKYRTNYNKLFSNKTKAIRNQLSLWTDESFIRNESN